MKILTMLLVIAAVLLAEEDPKQRVQVSSTQRLDFPSGGTLRLVHSIGELAVEAWDRPEVELSTTKSTKLEYDAKARERAARELDKVRVSAERRGDELVVTTAFPRRRGWPPSSLVGVDTSFDLKTNVKVPRNARLMVDQVIGEVHVDDIAGDIRVKQGQGTITLRLPGKSPSLIDARTRWGSITSDFPGSGKRRWWQAGQEFAQSSANASQKLHLRVGYGDIVILRIDTPPTPGAVASAANPNGL